MRYRVKRIGFVDFWLYRDQEFYFEDGRLLIRGANASGKSITTQSVIPFILDGDRRPERLDPFGSRDRKMEYYFLGLTERDDVTGYIYLEFYNEETDHYITLGIGQRARRNSAMNFWGFILKDGRRIKKDFDLYTTYGDKKIPLTKGELKNRLGEENIYTESQGEYEGYVNKYLFGFESKEEYKRLIDLLIKIRGSKLSREFRPTDMYGILNESLPTLSEEELKPMVEGMEKLDAIIENIKELDETLKEASVISKEFDKYNRFMLHRAAENYRESKDRFIKKEKDINSRVRETEKLLSEMEEITFSMDTLEVETARLEKEKNLSGAENIEEKISEKKRLGDELLRLEEQSGKISENIGIKNRKMREVLNDIEKLSSIKKSGEEKSDKTLSDITEILGSASYPDTMVFKNFTREIDEKSVIREGDKLKNHIRHLEDIREKLISSERLEDEADVILKKKDDAQKDFYREEKRLSETEKAVFEERENILLILNTLLKSWEIIKTDSETEDALKKTVISFGLSERSDVLQRILSPEVTSLKEAILSRQTLLIRESEILKGEIESKEEEIKLLREKTAPQYPRREETEEIRKLLLKNGIKAVPFYQAVDFKEDVSQEEKNITEAIIRDMNLLDILIVKDGDRNKALEIIKKGSDRILSFEGGEEEFGYSIGNSQLTWGMEEEVKDNNPLKTVSEDMEINEKAGKLTEVIFSQFPDGRFSTDGYFRYHETEGYSKGTEEASFIGEESRKKKLQKEMDKALEELSELKIKIEGIEESLESEGKKSEILKEEEKSIPDLMDLRNLLQEDKERENTLSFSGRRLKEITSELEEKEKRISGLKSLITNLSRNLPYERKSSAYTGVISDLDDARDLTAELLSIMRDIALTEERIIHTEDLRDETELQLNDLHDEDRNLSKRLKVVEAELKTISDFLSRDDIVEIHKRAGEIIEELDAARKELKELNNRYIRNETIADKNRSEEKEEMEMLLVLKNQMEENKKIFGEELDFGFLISPEELKSMDEDEILGTALDIRWQNEKNLTYQSVIDSLTLKFNTNTTRLSNYRIRTSDHVYLSRTGTGTRRLIILFYESGSVPLHIFRDKLTEEKKLKEELIRAEDRKIFEEILTGVLGIRLTTRIMESRKWIGRMSEIMESIDTSMKLTFSLDWKPKNPENEDDITTGELIRILTYTGSLIPQEDVERVIKFFRNSIENQKEEALMRGETLNYREFIANALDYRKWHEFRLNFKRAEGPKKELTNNQFNTFSGGEKAMAMYIPFLTAISSQYEKAGKDTAPRLLALDEAFAGVDDKNIETMFRLVEDLDFDFIFNSQSLWGTFREVDSLAISELLRGESSDVVIVQNYTWKGMKKILRSEEMNG